MERDKQKPRGFTPEQIKRIGQMWDAHTGKDRVLWAKKISGTPELDIPDGVLVTVDRKDTGERQIDYLRHEAKPKEPPSNPKQ